MPVASVGVMEALRVVTSVSAMRVAITWKLADPGRPSGPRTCPERRTLGGQVRSIPEAGAAIERCAESAGAPGSDVGAASTRYAPARSWSEYAPAASATAERAKVQVPPTLRA